MPGETSKLNGMKGGRPSGSKAAHTLEAQTLRQYLISRTIEEHKPLVEALIRKAKRGDLGSIKEVFERVLGKEKDPTTPKIIVQTLQRSIEEDREKYA